MRRANCICLALLLFGCAAPDPEREATIVLREALVRDAVALQEAAVALQATAPEPRLDGWAADAAAVTALQEAWVVLRDAYGRIEATIAILWPALHAALDASYEEIVELEADRRLFDRSGFVGIRAVERILWAGQHSDEVVAFESALDGYEAAALPASQERAGLFRDMLCQRLVEDATALLDALRAMSPDSRTAFHAVLQTVHGQIEKLTMAGTGADESRYSASTLADVRANLEGASEAYAAFSPWIRSIDEPLDDSVAAGFDRLAIAYDEVEGDALPAVPDGWNPDDPTAAHLDTPYGRVFEVVNEETRTTGNGSLVVALRTAAEAVDRGTPP